MDSFSIVALRGRFLFCDPCIRSLGGSLGYTHPWSMGKSIDQRGIKL